MSNDTNPETEYYSGETEWQSEWAKLPKADLIELAKEILDSRRAIWNSLDEAKAAKDHYAKEIHGFSDATKVAELKLAEREKFLAQQRKDDAARHERVLELKDQQIDRLTKERNTVTEHFDQVRFDPTCTQRVDMAKETLAKIGEASAALGSGAQPVDKEARKVVNNISTERNHSHPNAYPNF